MLIGDLYQVDGLLQEDGNITAQINLNTAHAIFEGHYPGQPVLPGACMLQMVKEVLTLAIGSEVVLVKTGQMKFLQMVSPATAKKLELKIIYKIEADTLKVAANLFAGEANCFKLQGSFIKQ